MEQEAALVEVFWGLIYLRVKTQNIKQEQCSNKLNKDFLNGPHEKKNQCQNNPNLLLGFLSLVPHH